MSIHPVNPLERPSNLASQQVDETVQFPIVAGTEAAAVVEINHESEEVQNEDEEGADDQETHTNPADMAQYFYNEDEEMLQLAMALSLKEAEAAAAASQETQKEPASSNIPNPSEHLAAAAAASEAALVYPTAPYLQNFAHKLLQLRKILLEKFSQHIEASVLESFLRKEKPPGECLNGKSLKTNFRQININWLKLNLPKNW